MTSTTSAVDSSNNGRLSFLARHARTYLFISPTHRLPLYHLTLTNLIYRALSPIHTVIVESVQVAPQLQQLLPRAPRRDNKARVRLHNQLAIAVALAPGRASRRAVVVAIGRVSCAEANAVSEGVAREAAVAVSVPRQSRSKDVIHAKHSLFIDSMLERVRVPVIHRDVVDGSKHVRARLECKAPDKSRA